MHDPDVVVPVDGDAGHLAEDPVLRQRLGPERLGPELRRVLRECRCGERDGQQCEDETHGGLPMVRL